MTYCAQATEQTNCQLALSPHQWSGQIELMGPPWAPFSFSVTPAPVDAWSADQEINEAAFRLDVKIRACVHFS